MKKSLLATIAFALCLVVSQHTLASHAGCVPAQTGSSMTFCLGESVFKLGVPGTGSAVNGPYVLIYITNAYSEAFIQSKTGGIESTLPALDLAVQRGCNDNGVCVGGSVLWNLNGHIQKCKVAGLFTGSDIVVECGSSRNGGVYYQLVTFGDYKKL